jgi:hypothetical protein
MDCILQIVLIKIPVSFLHKVVSRVLVHSGAGSHRLNAACIISVLLKFSRIPSCMYLRFSPYSVFTWRSEIFVILISFPAKFKNSIFKVNERTVFIWMY